MASFRGSKAFLSNFHPCSIQVEGTVLPSVEHAYVWYKTLDPSERTLVAMCKSPGEAKRLGRTLTLRPNWSTDLSLEIMLGLLRQKFADPALEAKLLATGDEELVEVNEWGDRFWGVCAGEGSNHLGKLLMQVRFEREAVLRNQEAQTADRSRFIPWSEVRKRINEGL